MPSNIEIKARASDLSRMRAVASELATAPMVVLEQVDVFFHCSHGRLKLRLFPDETAELIQYHRPDTQESKQSDYQIYLVDKPQEMRQLLARSLGERVVVKKRRELFLVDQTRIHLDQVEKLGDYMELEVVLRPGQSAAEGSLMAKELMTKLGVQQDDLVSCAYADLLLEKIGSSFE
ncbi:MAG: putative adenylyl cyclase CyaB [Planctomycetota bacterium]|jgi:predicted adenylyl cyclase CyaB